MTMRLGALLHEAEADEATRCVILTGAGDVAFSSGHDLGEMLKDREHASDAALNDPFLYPARMTTPTIAAINGYAYAVGFILALNCDLRVCAENASFAAPGARIGLLPIGGQISRLPRLMPQAVAHEMLLTCRSMPAEEAFRLGFVNRIAPRGQALEAALELARAIVANSSHVAREIKRGLEVLGAEGPAAAAAFEWHEGRRLQDGPDATEGMTAFLEKRQPRFT
jgi:enoyl-CoA hydratase/carnithine racemase